MLGIFTTTTSFRKFSTALIICLLAASPAFGIKYAYKLDSLSQVVKNQKDTTRVMTLFWISKECILISKLDTSWQLCEEMESISKRLSFNKGVMYSLCQKGTVLFFRSEYQKAKKIFEECLQMADNSTDFYMRGRVRQMLTITLTPMGEYQQAMEYALASCKHFEKIDHVLGIANMMTNIGNIYDLQKNYPKAIEYHFKSAHIAKKINYNYVYAISIGNAAAIYYKINDYKKAIENNLVAMKIDEEIDNQYDLMYRYSNLSDCYRGIKQYSKALESGQKSLQTARKIDNKEGIAQALMVMGEAHTEQNQKAMLPNLYICLSKAYVRAKKFSDAYRYLEIANTLNDSLITEKNSRIISEMYAKYENEKNENEIQLLKKDKEIQTLELDRQYSQLQKQKYIILISIITLSLSIFSVYLFFNRYRIKKRSNEQLTKANEQIQEKNNTISEAYDQIQLKNHQILNSLNYSKRLQDAVMTKETEIRKVLSNSFIFYRPKDIVSGDFYWFTHLDNKTIIVLADCTGHGVPGALMSMIGNTLLNQIVKEEKICTPAHILERLNYRLTKTFDNPDTATQENEHADGMEIAVRTLNWDSYEGTFSGANQSLFIAHDNELKILDGDLYSIGGLFKMPLQSSFKQQIFNLEKGMCIYLSSDGYMDQIGGTKKQRFMKKRFTALLKEVHRHDFSTQKKNVEMAFNEWKGNYTQVDDVLVWGIKV
jgi:serine phosphatase RsbU (regulator of sigma subunit)